MAHKDGKIRHVNKEGQVKYFTQEAMRNKGPKRNGYFPDEEGSQKVAASKKVAAPVDEDILDIAPPIEDETKPKKNAPKSKK